MRPPGYHSWVNARTRCYNKNSIDYPRYGGRGITMCKEWNSLVAFMADMGPKPDGHTLDRIDTNGNYEPRNCRWADWKTQQRNRRNNKVITASGRTCCIAKHAEVSNIPRNTIESRIRRGWTENDAATVPVQTHKRNKRAK